ncbi:hypothetical protein LAZ40_18305 [Cereibacter sphaeroides]|uniref:hypothetical protein n=1 Tax=Cereibacter sphaeroides TaxID=1063 RepID=UPI001F38979C|nr:hypothetical protein [Cereibacter sphaeroides]MCE6952322.1 hypothetical protein [Cereibacter sphaeroides]MCE6960983.1 hypothetical protein [Cereibacter sphaeroides]MCE6975194.1 hypothetical protein [Cereibacter sphaeroides]
MRGYVQVHSCYLVALKHVVIAEDVAQAIRDHDPAADVILGRDPRAIPEDRVPLVAFLGLSPAEAGRLPAVQDLLARGTRLVLIGDEAEDAGEGRFWWVLPRPFTSDAVLALLVRAAEERGSQAAE